MRYIFFIGMALVPLSLALPTTEVLHRRLSLDQITDTLLFKDTMAQFQAARDATDPPQLDWSSDGCSDSPDDPLGFNFLPCCQRHDFGYRNYKAQDRFTDAGKARIDSNFKSDMYKVCAGKSLLEKDACEGTADVYYEAVKEFGSKKRAAEALEEISEKEKLF